LIAAPLTLMITATMAIPVLLANGDPPGLVACAPDAASIEQILATIRRVESGDNYQAQAAGSSASGAYQIIDSTWNHYAGYRRAAHAPPDIQDTKAADMVAAILDTHSDVEAVPVIWYIGHLPSTNSPRWDTVPAPEAGNRLTPRQYQTRWLNVYHQLADNQPTTTPTTTQPNTTPTPTPSSTLPPGCIGGPGGETLPGGWALPAPRSILTATTRQFDDPHPDYPAWDWMIPTGTPIYAIRSGTVAIISAWPHNWWEQGCTTRGIDGCSPCGIGVTIIDTTDNTRWTYCHGSDLHVTAGARIEAGQLLITSGNTGRSGGPHLHLEIRTTGGTQRCPQPLIAALYNQHTGINPANLPTTGCTF
jgi:murein DD-endopeptidase MepM/ murein hydrolase activator NlpD